MIRVDTSTGSNELVDPLERLGLPVKASKMEYGDLVFMGRGEKGEKLLIGIEFKKVSELVQSIHTTKRFQGHQLVGMSANFDRRYLLIEGDWHHDERGRVVQYRKGRRGPVPLRGAPNAIVLEQELLNIATRGGCPVVQRSTRRDSLRWIVACYRYWTDKDLDEHKSHLAIYAPDFDKHLLHPPTPFRESITRILPGIGFTASKAVEDAVGGGGSTLRAKLHRLTALTEEQWAGLEVRDTKGNLKRLGASRAKAIMEALDR